MDQDEEMFGTEVTISNPKQEKPKKSKSIKLHEMILDISRLR